MTRPTLAPPQILVHDRAALEAEAERLYRRIRQPENWDLTACLVLAPLTLEINDVKHRRNAVILAHTYQTPDIVYGVADHVGDSYGLSKKARDSNADVIVFSSVRFMGETAKIVNPDKTVLMPEPRAGCSLADGVTAHDVRRYRHEHPDAAIVSYVNTTAEVKALSDVCVTSANYLKICKRLPQEEIVFLPDKYMGMYLAKQLAGEKRVYYHDALCVVHKDFRAESARHWRNEADAAGRQLVIMAHPECAPNVLEEADFIGSTEAMIEYARRLEADGRVDVMAVTECGVSDRLKAEFPSLNVWGSCSNCPYMKENDLRKILQVLQSPRQDQEIRIPPQILAGAKRALDRMFELAA